MTLTSTEVATILGVEPGVLKSMRREAQGPPFHMYADTIRYNLDEVKQWHTDTWRSAILEVLNARLSCTSAMVVTIALDIYSTGVEARLDQSTFGDDQ